MSDEYADLVDVRAGRVSRRVFADPAVYEAELDRVFARSWLCVGHGSELPRPGDYVTRLLADDAVIFCRDQAGAVHVFLNAANRTEVYNWFLADAQASDAYKGLSLKMGIATFTPAGMFDQDDAEVWAAMGRASRGRRGMRQRSSFERIGAARRHPMTDFPGPGQAYTGAYTEISEFDLLVRWQELMAA